MSRLTVGYFQKKREKFEDIKGVIRSRKFKKDIYYDVQKKTDNDLQNTTHKRLIEQQVPHKKQVVNSGVPERVISSCSTSSTRRITLVSR